MPLVFLQTKGTSGTRKQSLGDKCHICHQKVYLMERHLEGGKLYHRHCFRESQKSSFRAYRGVRSQGNQESKENISPQSRNLNKSPPNQTNGASVNGNAGATAKSMARFWDSKIADTKRLPSSSSSSNSSPALSGRTSPQPQYPDTKSTLSTETKWSPPGQDDHLVKARTPKPWSPIMDSPPKASNYRGFDPVGSDKSPKSPISPVSPSRSVSSPPPGPLSPGAVGLFPHYQVSSLGRNIPQAPVETMEVDEVSDDDSKLGAASVKRANLKTSQLSSGLPNPILNKPTSPSRWSPVKPEVTTSRSPPITSPRALPQSSRSPPPNRGQVPGSGEASIVSGLLHSLSNIRQRHDIPDINTGKVEQKPASINNKVQKSPPSPTKPPTRPDLPRSILKSGGTDASSVSDELQASNLSKGPRPILKHKDSPTSNTVCDAPKASDNLRLRSILKAGTDAESGPATIDNSPRSILKRHDDFEDEAQIGSGHGILKLSDGATPSDSVHDYTSHGPRSILKTGMYDPDTSISQDESPRPGKSILKSRKHSGDSLFSSSGDELEELSPRPILKTSPRSEALVSPTSDRKSILKTKGLSSQSPSNTRDSPKPILKSRESSPSPITSSSPLKVAEPTKPILKKGVETPMPTKSAWSQQVKSPSGPSVLRTTDSEEAGRPGSSFAAFKSTSPKSYTSNLGLGDKDNKAVSTLGTGSDKPRAAPRRLDSKPSPTSGARNKPDTNTKQKSSTLIPKTTEDDKPEWMREAEKRQAARGGKYLDPEKSYLEKNTKSSTIASPTRSFSPPTSFTFNSGEKKKAGTIDRPKPFVRKTSPREEPMEVDSRPEWQKEAEKRQAARKGFYPDPEKPTVGNKSSEPEIPLTNGKATANKVPDKPVPFYGGQTVPNLVNKQLEKEHIKSGTWSTRLPVGAPPPKPLRSPLPQRSSVHSEEGKKAENGEDEFERQRLAAIRKHPSILQRNKKNPPPPRPVAPPQVEKKKIVPSSEFTFDPIRGRLTRPGQTSPQGEGVYAEVGPPSRRKPVRNEENALNRFSHRPLPPLPRCMDESGEGTPTPKRKVISFLSVIEM